LVAINWTCSTHGGKKKRILNVYTLRGEKINIAWERDGKGMGTLHGSGRCEMHAELYWGSQTEKILSIGGRIILKIMFVDSMGVSVG
jgi:hypothetical protein